MHPPNRVSQDDGAALRSRSTKAARKRRAGGIGPPAGNRRSRRHRSNKALPRRTGSEAAPSAAASTDGRTGGPEAEPEAPRETGAQSGSHRALLHAGAGADIAERTATPQQQRKGTALRRAGRRSAGKY